MICIFWKNVSFLRQEALHLSNRHVFITACDAGVDNNWNKVKGGRQSFWIWSSLIFHGIF